MRNAGFRWMAALPGILTVALVLMAGGPALAQDSPASAASPMAKCHVQQLFAGADAGPDCGGAMASPGCGGAMMGAGPCGGCPMAGSGCGGAMMGAGPGCGGAMMGPGGGMLRGLDLSEDQQKRVKEIHESKRAEHVRLQKEMARLQNQLEGELLKDSPAVETLRSLAGQIGSIRTQEMVLRLETRLAVRGVLTAEQRDRMLTAPRGPRGGCGEMRCGRGHRCGGPGCGQRPGPRLGCGGQGCQGANPPGTCRGAGPDASKDAQKGK